MKRGSYGSPYRPPADGWFVPPCTYFGGLYQHQRPALNNLPRMVNNTQITLQPNQVGRPMTRGAVVSLSAGTCEQGLSNGLPTGPWVGPGSDQGLPPVLGGVLTNTFQQNGTNSFGLATRLRGGKWVQAVRQWHGEHGWLSHDSVACADQLCVTQVTDQNGKNPGEAGYIATYSTHAFEGPQPAPDQTQYLTFSPSGFFSWYNDNTDDRESKTASISGSIDVDATSGKITHSLISTEDDAHVDYATGVSTQTFHASGGAGFTRPAYTDPPTNFSHGMSTIIDALAGANVHCAHPGIPLINKTVDGEMDTFNNFIYANMGAAVAYSLLPPITNANSYGSASAPNTGQVVFSDGTLTHTIQIAVWFQRTSTSYSCGIVYDDNYNLSGPDNPHLHWEFACTLTLSNAHTSAGVYGDVKNLLGYWPLNDDAIYPPRTDGIWQVAPLVSRDERETNVSPCQGFLPATVDDLRAPIADANGNAPWSSNANPPPPGWHYAPNNNDSSGRPPSDPNYGGPASWNNTYAQMAWFDDNAYGWQFPVGFGMETAPATALVQYGCTGLICGMPMPRAFTDANSYWYLAGYTPPANATYENFFDYRAQIFHACEWFDENGGGPYVDLYLYGYGEWLYDAITRTGAQLPHCATQWTNNAAAQTKPPYAYLIQADQRIYDWQGLQPGPSSDFTAYRASALWAQKCMEISELWPSQDFFGPAAANRNTPGATAAGRYAPDETAVYCINSVDGAVINLTSAPTGIANSDWVGINSNGFSGVYEVAAVSALAQTVTLGALIWPLPAGFALPSGDDGVALWRIRFPAAPAILGRDAVATLTAVDGGATQITLAAAEPFLQSGDVIDICAAQVTYDGAGNKTGESMSVLSSGQTVTMIDGLHCTVPVAMGGLSGATHIVSHGAPAWFWDDTFRKGDFAAMQWLYDYRTNGEVSRLAGTTDCAGNTPPTGSPSANSGYQPTAALAAACTASNGLTWDGAAFSAAGQIVFKPCCYGAIAITPNGETWPNAVVIPFPDPFLFDGRYGARWQAEIEQAMTDLYWQAPHTPCAAVNNLTDDPVSGSDIVAEMDDGTCKASYADDSAKWHFVYAHAPMVEARLALPDGAPALPAGITLGYGNPVTYPAVVGALYPPGQIGYDPASGNPAPAWTIWGYRLNLDGTCGGCRFDYVNMENLACMAIAYTSPSVAIPDGSTTDGSTGDGLT